MSKLRNQKFLPKFAFETPELNHTILKSTNTEIELKTMIKDIIVIDKSISTD